MIVEVAHLPFDPEEMLVAPDVDPGDWTDS